MSKNKVSMPKDKQNNKKNEIPPEEAEIDDSVKLKPLVGIRPGVYLTVIYSILIITILFFLLVFPGLINPGAVIIVKTEPEGAAVRVDDVYRGLAGSKIFIPDGTYTIEAVMPGFEKQGIHQTIKGRVFASLFFPRRYIIEFPLKTADPAASFALYAAEFAEWTFAGEPVSSWQIPMTLSEGAYRAGHYAGDKIGELKEILTASSRFTVTRAALRDLIRAKILLDNMGSAPSAAALLNSISDILVFLSDNPGSDQWLLDLLPPNSPVSGAIQSSEWHKHSAAAAAVTAGVYNSGMSIDLLGLRFSHITGEHSGEFYISETSVPISLYETFLNENPQWREQRTDYYPQEISVSPLEIYRGSAVTGITWYAAGAFCKWLSGFLPSSFADMEIRLPTEIEWQTASLSVNNMRIPGWEWCADFYAPLDFITASHQAVNLLGSPERSLRGRQSLNSTETRAYLPPNFSSPFVTFRPVIASNDESSPKK